MKISRRKYTIPYDEAKRNNPIKARYLIAKLISRKLRIIFKTIITINAEIIENIKAN